MDEVDANYQLILWRSHLKDKLEYTYGTTIAPYLPTRCLNQLASEEQKDFSTASNVLMHDFYVDDLLTGAEAVDQVYQPVHELKDILHRGGFTLQKWREFREQLSNINKVRISRQMTSTQSHRQISIQHNCYVPNHV
ncbi:putative GPI ethanolamine phosphate transferase [Trypoxylus dichotomus]